jgi:hypothetical protein
LQSNRFGDIFRFLEGPYPDGNSPIILQLQQRQGTAWRTIQIFPIQTGQTEVTASAYISTSTASKVFGNAVWNVFDFDTILFDDNTTITTGTSWAFTVPSGMAGKYLITGSVQSTTSTQLDARIGVFLNASFSSPPQINTWSQMYEFRDSASPSAVLSRPYSVLLNCADGDTIRIGGQCGGTPAYNAVATSTSTRYSFFHAIKIS